MKDHELDEFEKSLRGLHAASHAEIEEFTDVAEEFLKFKRRAYAEAAEATSGSRAEIDPQRAVLVETTELLLRMSLTDEIQIPPYAYRDVVRVVSGKRPSLRKLVSAAGLAGLFSGMAGVAALALLVGKANGTGWWIFLSAAVLIVVALIAQMAFTSTVSKIDTFTVRVKFCGSEFVVTKAPTPQKSTAVAHTGKSAVAEIISPEISTIRRRTARVSERERSPVHGPVARGSASKSSI